MVLEEKLRKELSSKKISEIKKLASSKGIFFRSYPLKTQLINKIIEYEINKGNRK